MPKLRVQRPVAIALEIQQAVAFLDARKVRPEDLRAIKRAVHTKLDDFHRHK